VPREKLPDHQCKSCQPDGAQGCPGNVQRGRLSSPQSESDSRFCFFWISCFSSSVAPAGKIAGKARKSPPNARPKCLARTAAMTLMAPPKIKRTVYSDHLFCARRQNGKRLAWASGRTRPNRQEMHKVIVLEPRWLLELREIFPANINWQHTRE
jgi:hypothetical protein